MSMTIHMLYSCLVLITLTQTWRGSAAPTGSGGSQNSADRTRAETYLKKFGYLPNNPYSIASAISDEDLRRSIETFQRRGHLPITGVLDAATTNLMDKPRCGVPDVSSGSSGSLAAYGVHSTKWQNTFIRYIIPYNDYSASYPRASTDEDVLNALRMWSSVAPVNFQRVTDSNLANLVIRFRRWDHGDGNSFDGRGTILAHAFFPTDGRIHFDDDEIWTRSLDGNAGTNFFEVALHEFGHALGLQHSEEVNAVMFPYYDSNYHKRTLHPDDIAGIRSLYGECIPSTNTFTKFDNTRATSTVGRESVCSYAPFAGWCEYYCLLKQNPSCEAYDYKENSGDYDVCTIYVTAKETVTVQTYYGYSHYQRQLCESRTTTTSTTTQQPSACNSYPCQNGGRCSEDYYGYTCTCPPEFEGVNCRTRKQSTCNSSPCQNGGICSGDYSQYRCTCPYQFEGVNCQTRIQISACSSNPCQNGGACSGDYYQYVCYCTPAFTGTNCQTRKQSACNSSPCQNGGSCYGDYSQYTCTCPNGFAGTNCQTLSYCPNNNDFLCADRLRCIYRNWVCDSYNDCRDNSDEWGCASTTLPTTKTTTPQCRYDEYLCRTRQVCMDGWRVCDGYNDCWDWSDELSCPTVKPTEPTRTTLQLAPLPTDPGPFGTTARIPIQRSTLRVLGK